MDTTQSCSVRRNLGSEEMLRISIRSLNLGWNRGRITVRWKSLSKRINLIKLKRNLPLTKMGLKKPKMKETKKPMKIDLTLMRVTSETDRDSYLTKRTWSFRVRRSRKSMTNRSKIRRKGSTNKGLTNRLILSSYSKAFLRTEPRGINRIIELKQRWASMRAKPVSSSTLNHSSLRTQFTPITSSPNIKRWKRRESWRKWRDKF